MIKIGLFGGSFDPIHLGHLAIARYARDKFSLDQVHFIVTKNSPFKINSTVLNSIARLQIVSKAISGEKNFFVSDFEIKQEENISYSYKTVAYFRNKHPEAQLYWIMGYDAFATLQSWSHYEYLKSNLEFIVFCRDHITAPKIIDAGLVHYFVQDFDCDISSTMVRHNLTNGSREHDAKPLDKLIPASVIDLVLQQYPHSI